MKIYIRDSYKDNHCVCYAIIFDTGYFYIGATTMFKERTSMHVQAIKKRPKDYLIGIEHNPKECEIIKLVLCHDKELVFKREIALLSYYADDPKLINKKTINKFIRSNIFEINKYKNK
jgi:hypothetical protein